MSTFGGTRLILLYLLSCVVMPAGNILWFTDFDLGTNVIPGGIALAGHTGTEATDLADFNVKLTSMSWDAVIFGEQNNLIWNDVSVNLTAYVAGGGKVIGATWLDTPMATFFDAVETGNNATQITADAHPIWAGLPGTIDLVDPGWGVFSQDYAPVGGAVATGSLGGNAAVIIGNGGATILNGPLFDTYANVAEGERLVANELGFLLAQTAIPEPGTVSMLALGVGALLFYARRRR
jgi:hypothetical protein